MMTRLLDRALDWRLAPLRRERGLPDLPEVRRMLRLSWLNGFTGGAFRRQAAAAGEEGLEALLRHARGEMPS
jgi:hypothetical protein